MSQTRLPKSFCMLLLPALWIGSLSWAQGPREVDALPLDAELFPPEMVMRHSEKIDLSDEQSRSILDAVKEAQGGILEGQWGLRPELEKLRRILAQPRIPEEEAKAQLARVMEEESRVKELQLMLMVRVKNLLTPEQQRRLQELRSDERRRPELGRRPARGRRP